MAMSKRSSHPSLAERAAIDADRIRNYASGNYRVARDGSLRDASGRFVPGTKTSGGFDYHPEHRRKGGGWDKRMTVSYQYRRFLAMQKTEFVKLGKQYQVFKLNIGDNPRDYPPKDHTIVEEAALIAVFKSAESIKYLKEITKRVEGTSSRKTYAHH